MQQLHSWRIAIATSALAALLAAPFIALAKADACPDISGMALIAGTTSFLVVHDAKAGSGNPHLGLITVNPEGGYTYTPLSADWPGWETNDIESAYGIRSAPSEFLVSESGSWTDRKTKEFHQGRIFHISLTQDGGKWSVNVLHTLPLPPGLNDVEGMVSMLTPSYFPTPGQYNAGYDSQYRDQVRPPSLSSDSAPATRPPGAGTTVYNPEPAGPHPYTTTPDGQKLYMTIVLGVRGGKWPYEPPRLRWGVADLTAGTFELNDSGGQALNRASGLNPWARGCSDLYLDDGGALWVSTAEDPGDAGPYRSTIYRYGDFTPQGYGMFGGQPDFSPYGYTETLWTIEGLKVEALAAPVLGGSVLSYATDDEAYGGIWRPLGPAAARY